MEDWTIENHAPEVHEFHMHQIHFLLLAVNGVPAPPEQRQFYDTYQVGYWDQTGPYPSIKVRMDFRGPVVGDFVYHCHILQHEDAGMMAIIRVQPKAKKKRRPDLGGRRSLGLGFDHLRDLDVVGLAGGRARARRRPR